MFLCALNEQDRLDLLSKGFEEVGTCKINNEIVYYFENSPSKYATFSKEDQSKYLVTNVAYFV